MWASFRARLQMSRLSDAPLPPVTRPKRRHQNCPGFPFSNFDPFHPDRKLLPQVGRFFDQPARRRLPRALLGELQNLGRPPASGRAWQQVLKARHEMLTNETKQIKAALANDPAAFVRTVYQQSRDYNQLVFTSAVFGVQTCTFS